MKSSVNILENNLLFKIDLGDGTSRWFQIPENQARDLGIQVQTDIKQIEEKTVPDIVEEQHEFTQDIEVSDKIVEDKTSHFVYKIMKPEDLDLKPVVKTHLPRGRPRKRTSQKVDKNNEKPLDKVQKVIKQVRTRSGRITKPPKHIKKDFQKIDITEDGKNELDLKTSDFEPLKTNETPKEEPLQVLKQHVKKRTISPRFRCPTCNKAYLGRMKMRSHFQKYPDHGPTYCKLKNNATWDFLILTSQKYKEGPKGIKFCQELEALLQNARILAQFLFKPVENNKNDYFVNEALARVFGISAGKYCIDDTELNKNMTLYEYQEDNEVIKVDDANVNCEVSNKINDAKHYTNVDMKESKKTVSNGIQNDCVTDRFNSFDYMINNTQNMLKKNFIDKPISNIDLTLNSQSSHNNIEFPLPNTSHNVIINKEEVKNGCTNAFINLENSETSTTNCQAVVKYELSPKSNFLFNNHEYTHINNDLNNVIDTNHLNLTNYNNLEIKEATVFHIENHKNDNDATQHISEKQHNSHITLQNELRDVDELMLVNVDTGQVSNILDTSSNSDDIMNVDQFVNERFKKLTEPDIDIQNNLLNLELPPLDIFQFHTS